MNVTFPNSPFLDNLTVMGTVIIAEHLTLRFFFFFIYLAKSVHMLQSDKIKDIQISESTLEIYS